MASPARSTSMLGGGGRVYCKTYIHAYMHAYICPHIYTCGCISKIKAIMNGRPFIRNLIYLSTSERSELGQFWHFWQILTNNNVWSQLRQIIGGAKGYSTPLPSKKILGGGGGCSLFLCIWVMVSP